MAGQVLLTISKDEAEQARLTSEYKFIVDHQSKMVDARREGVEEGIRKGVEEGIKKGVEEGIKKGVEEGIKKGLLEGHRIGSEEKAFRIAERSLRRGADPEDVAYALELPLSKIMEIKAGLS